jgi:hypothetical protein
MVAVAVLLLLQVVDRLQLVVVVAAVLRFHNLHTRDWWDRVVEARIGSITTTTVVVSLHLMRMKG